MCGVTGCKKQPAIALQNYSHPLPSDVPIYSGWQLANQNHKLQHKCSHIWKMNFLGGRKEQPYNFTRMDQKANGWMDGCSPFSSIPIPICPLVWRRTKREENVDVSLPRRTIPSSQPFQSKSRASQTGRNVGERRTPTNQFHPIAQSSHCQLCEGSGWLDGTDTLVLARSHSPLLLR